MWDAYSKVAKAQMGCNGRILSKNFLNLKDRVLLKKSRNRKPLAGPEAFQSTKCTTVCVAHVVRDSAPVSLGVCASFLFLQRECESLPPGNTGPSALLKNITSISATCRDSFVKELQHGERQTPGRGSTQACQPWSMSVVGGGEAPCGWDSERKGCV